MFSHTRYISYCKENALPIRLAIIYPKLRGLSLEETKRKKTVVILSSAILVYANDGINTSKEHLHIVDNIWTLSWWMPISMGNLLELASQGNF